MSAGMMGFIEKPVKLELLKKMLSEICSSDKALSFPENKNDNNNYADRPLINRDHLIDLLKVLGCDRLTELIGAMALQVKDGIPALINEQAVQDLQVQSHDMAGVSGNLGAERMNHLFSDIETSCKDGNLQRALELVTLVPAAWRQTHMALQRFVTD